MGFRALAIAWGKGKEEEEEEEEEVGVDRKMAKELGESHSIIDSISQNACGEPVKHGDGGGDGGANVSDTCNNSSSKWKSNDFGSWEPGCQRKPHCFGCFWRACCCGAYNSASIKTHINHKMVKLLIHKDSQDTIAFSEHLGVGSINEMYPQQRTSEAFNFKRCDKARVWAVITTGN